jgi:hypothetical protein
MRSPPTLKAALDRRRGGCLPTRETGRVQSVGSWPARWRSAADRHVTRRRSRVGSSRRSRRADLTRSVSDDADSPPGQSMSASPRPSRSARSGSTEASSSKVSPSAMPMSASDHRSSTSTRRPGTARAMARAVWRARRVGLETIRPARTHAITRRGSGRQPGEHGDRRPPRRDHAAGTDRRTMDGSTPKTSRIRSRERTSVGSPSATIRPPSSSTRRGKKWAARLRS